VTIQYIPSINISPLFPSPTSFPLSLYPRYGAEQGVGMLREKIATKLYEGRIAADEVFVSDGAKCDIARLQLMFGKNVVTAVQDPSYPVYVDTAVIMGQTGLIDENTRQFDGTFTFTRGWGRGRGGGGGWCGCVCVCAGRASCALEGRLAVWLVFACLLSCRDTRSPFSYCLSPCCLSPSFASSIACLTRH